MANQIKGKYIKDGAIDGSKFLLKNNDGLRALKANGDSQVLFKLDSSDNLVLLKVPQITSDATNANDLVRKSQLDTEASARQAAVSELSTRIDNVLSNVDGVALNSLAEIVAAFQQADSDLNGAISSLASSASSGLETETSARQAADASLQSQIDNLGSSGGAALAQEVSDRQAADAALQSDIDAEASARQAADNTLQSNINAEASIRQAADSALQSAIDSEAGARISAVNSEASARQAADAALQAAIDALTADDLTDVATSGKADGDLFQWDAAVGKWKNVAPLSEATTSTIVVPGSETLVSGFTNTVYDNDSAGAALGTTYRPTSNMTVSKVGLKIGRSSNLTTNVTAKIYEVASYVVTTNNGNYNPSDFTLIATSTNSLAPSDLALYPATPQMEYWTFDNVPLTQGGYYVIWAEVEGVSFGVSSLNYLAPSYAAGYHPDNHYKQSQTNGTWGGDYNLVLGYEVYTGSAGSSSEVADVGVIKTNAQGLLDDSFIDVTIARSSDLASETAARQAADTAEQSARQAADSAEASARQAADNTLQSNINAEISARQAAVLAEQTARQAADSGLQSAIDAEKARIDAILLASDADKDSFAEIVQLINSVDTTNDSAFASYVLSNDAALAQEVSDRQSAVSSEASARQAADASLQNQIDNLGSSGGAALTQEISDRQAADAGLQSNIDAEASARQSADAMLQSAIDAEVSARQAADSAEVTARNAAIAVEASAREAADTILQSNIDSEASARAAAVSSEASARAAADQTLQSNIDSEVSARQSAVSAEQSARQSADQTLQSNIDSEASARAAAVSSEASARQAADAGLDTRLQAVEAVAVTYSKVKIVVSATDISNGYVDLPHAAVQASIVGSVDRLMIHETDDYTVSVVGGVTRITFVGNLVDPSEEKLAEGDILRFTYAVLAI